MLHACMFYHLARLLMQPTPALAQLVIQRIADIPERTSNPQLREHLLRAALTFIASLSVSVTDGDKVRYQLLIHS